MAKIFLIFQKKIYIDYCLILFIVKLNIYSQNITSNPYIAF